MKKHRWLQHVIIAASLAIGTSAVAPFPGNISYAAAAVTKLEQIRVALFIDTGKYTVTTPSVTLSSDKGIGLSAVQTSGTVPLSPTGSAGAVKASLDQPLVVLLETSDQQQASALYKSLDGADKPAGIVSRSKGGQPVYQVYAGPYATKETAAAAKDALLKMPAAAAAAKSFEPYVAGPLHWNAGTYATEAEASAQAAAIAQAGFAAEVAYIDNGGAAPYAAFVGSETTADGLNTLKARIAQALPNVALQPVASTASYAIKRTELTGSAGKDAGLAAFAINGAVKLVASSAQPGIKVAEKAGRVYRGTIELSVLNGKLAVVNELPFEQYVYSVVGSELGKSWPKEALKAQAVAARTFALKLGTKYQIAHISDSTSDQVYKGMTVEAAEITAAVDETSGEVLTDADGLITPYFYSNAGGMTADPVEVWGKPISYLQSVPSPDELPVKVVAKPDWYKIAMSNGSTGYISAMYVKDTGKKNEQGQPLFESTGSAVNVRPAPGTDNVPLFKVNVGDKFAVIDQAAESAETSNAYSWVKGPYTADELLSKINAAMGTTVATKLNSLEVSSRGPSGRVTEIKLNGQPLKVAYPDSLRTVLGGLPSTRFEIEGAGGYTIGGTETPAAASDTGTYYVLGASGQVTPISSSRVSIVGKDNVPRAAAAATAASSTASASTGGNQYVFRGKGNGHGLGMSQYGAKGYAELGYDYKKILQTYYIGVSVVKG